MSVLALIANVSLGNFARAEGSDQPQVWIELGGALSRQGNSQETYSPPFLALEPSEFSSPQKFQRPPLHSFDESGAISFSPKRSSWTFAVYVRYGRSNGDKKFHQQTYPGTHPRYEFDTIQPTPLFPAAAEFIDSKTKTGESHMVIDFAAGKDLGLGLFGSDGTSVVSAGVRIAQFIPARMSRSEKILTGDFIPSMFPCLLTRSIMRSFLMASPSIPLLVSSTRRGVFVGLVLQSPGTIPILWLATPRAVL